MKKRRRGAEANKAGPDDEETLETEEGKTFEMASRDVMKGRRLLKLGRPRNNVPTNEEKRDNPFINVNLTDSTVKPNFVVGKGLKRGAASADLGEDKKEVAKEAEEASDEPPVFSASRKRVKRVPTGEEAEEANGETAEGDVDKDTEEEGAKVEEPKKPIFVNPFLKENQGKQGSFKFSSDTGNNMFNAPKLTGGFGSGSFKFSWPKKPPTNDESKGEEEKVEEETEEKEKPVMKKASAGLFPESKDITHKTGEEEEKTEFEAKAKLYIWSDKEWKERGKGNFRVNSFGGKEGKVKYRCLMRSDAVQKLLVNATISQSTKFDKHQKKNLTCLLVNHPDVRKAFKDEEDASFLLIKLRKDEEREALFNLMKKATEAE